MVTIGMRPNLGVLELAVAAGDAEAHPRVVRVHGETRLIQSGKEADAAQIVTARWVMVTVMRSGSLLVIMI